MTVRTRSRGILGVFVAGVVLTGTGLVVAGDKNEGTGPVLEVTADAMFGGGTQPLSGGLDDQGMNVDLDPILPANNCTTCHADYGSTDPFEVVQPYRPWAASMMGQSARDPIFHAAMVAARQDVGDDGLQFCIRCHVPNAFLEGREPITPDDFTPIDLEGINCNLCHRMVDPIYNAGTSPAVDEAILASLDDAGWLPNNPNNARIVISPAESRRGPFPFCETPGDCGPEDVPINPHGVPTLGSEFHISAEMCWTCHGVSNPLFTRQPDDTYILNELDQPHPTGSELDMFPLHRTFQEWENSYYSSIGVNHVGRFGGTKTEPLRDCQDCHLPDTQGYGCNLTFPPFFERINVPQHSFTGANTWVMQSIQSLYPDVETGLTPQTTADALTRTVDFLQKASDMYLFPAGDDLQVRIFNFTGHKLPTGFPDGRRMWINVKFFDCQDQLINEHGEYDFSEADLTEDDTKVYEMIQGIGTDLAKTTGLPEGETFRFILANEILKDNRIPPTGWFAHVAEENQTLPVGATYANGQFWDDTFFAVPAGSARAVATVYYQTTSKEFIEFLRDSDPDKSPSSAGQIAFTQWELHGKSSPVVMDMAEIELATFHPADLDEDGNVNTADLLALLSFWGICDPPPPAGCVGDVDGDGLVNTTDMLLLLAAWGEPCI